MAVNQLRPDSLLGKIPRDLLRYIIGPILLASCRDTVWHHADDIDRDDLGPWGGQIKTPNLNQLASEGIRFDNMYANVAMCAPFILKLNK